MQRLHVVFCAESEEAANEADGPACCHAYQAAGINLGSAITSFCRWGPSRSTSTPSEAPNAASEGVNDKIEVLEPMAYRVQVESNYVARPAWLRRPPAGAVACMMTAPGMDDRDSSSRSITRLSEEPPTSS